MCGAYPGISLGDNPYSINRDPELRVSIHSCRYFLAQIEKFFKELFSCAGLPVETGLWPRVQSRTS
jgi:hypothetical protein